MECSFLSMVHTLSQVWFVMFFEAPCSRMNCFSASICSATEHVLACSRSRDSQQGLQL